LHTLSEQEYIFVRDNIIGSILDSRERKTGEILSKIVTTIVKNDDKADWYDMIEHIEE
jgi:hypothetical protein